MFEDKKKIIVIRRKVKKCTYCYCLHKFVTVSALVGTMQRTKNKEFVFTVNLYYTMRCPPTSSHNSK